MLLVRTPGRRKSRKGLPHWRVFRRGRVEADPPLGRPRVAGDETHSRSFCVLDFFRGAANVVAPLLSPPLQQRVNTLPIYTQFAQQVAPLRVKSLCIVDGVLDRVVQRFRPARLFRE